MAAMLIRLPKLGRWPVVDAAVVLGDATPAGFERSRHDALVPGDFDEIAAAVLAWRIQRLSGIEVPATVPTVTAGSRVTLRVPVNAFARVAVPVEVLEVVQRPDLVGFVYGALPGHPEIGSEAFLVHRVDGGAMLGIRVVSRPAPLLRLAGPLAHAMQQRFTARYLSALQQTP